ncbi:MAG: MFS transporter [Candidatus Bathyarchaeota archaeon]|nr:MFS transporter [Candidatus Bathyarchaeota archaeon]
MAKEDEHLEESKALYLAGASQSIPDTIIDRFTGTIAVAVGANVAESGLINGGRQLALTLPQVIFGGLADQLGKKKIIIAGRVLSGLLLAVLAFVGTPFWLLILVLAVSVAIAMAQPAWGSLVADYAGELRRGTIIGRINSVAQIGGLAAMVTALLITLNQTGPMSMASFTPLLLLASASSFASAILISLTEERAPTGERRRNLDFGSLFGDKDLKRFLIVSFVFGFGAATASPFFSYITVGKLGMSIWQIAASAAANLAFNVVGQRVFGRIIDRVGRRPVIVFSRVGMAASTLVYAFATNWVQIVAIEAFVGIELAAWACGQSTFIIDIAPSRLRATYLAASMTAVGVSNFLGSYIMGTLSKGFIASTDYAAISMALLFTAVLRFTFGFLFFTVRESKPTSQAR